MTPGDLFTDLSAVSLDAMNDRAALQRRTDNKYVVALDDLAALVDELADTHEVLEIDGDRVFDYESTYFDTPSLRCFHDHVRDRRPRFKARTRCYVATGDCYFEVKVKREDGETLKRSIDYDPDERATIRPAARDLVHEVLPMCGIDEPESDPRTSLVTSFRRVTVVAREAPERTTFDFDVDVRAPGGDRARFDAGHAIAETKTAEGDGAWDRALRAAGREPVSLSKYRIGAGLLLAPGEDEDYARELKELFRLQVASR
jgi:hypothetical protein